MGHAAMLAVLLAGLLGVPPACRADDLLQAYRQARNADPVLSAADAARRIAGEGVAHARAPLLPQAAAGFVFEQTRVGGGPRKDGVTAAENRSRKLAASVSQTLVDAGALARVDAARAQAAAQDGVYRAVEQALLVRVATAYFNVLTAGDTLATVQANEDALRQQVEQADQRWRNGISALVDLEQARAYHASARAGTIGARKALADAHEALAEITGTAPADLRGLRDELPMDAPLPADPRAWVAAALANNPLLQAQQSSIGAAEKNIAAARAGHLPTLNAALAVGRGAAWPLAANNDGRSVTSVGIVLNLPLFAGGAVQSRVRQALHQRDAARDELELRRRRVAREVLEHYRSVVAGIGQTEATRAAVDAARKALASTRVGQGLGTQSMTDLLLAIQTLASAQNAYSQARHQFILSRLLLKQAAGTVDEADLVAVNTLLR
jgi:outer membrane protein